MICFHKENYQIDVSDYFVCDNRYNCAFDFELDTLPKKCERYNTCKFLTVKIFFSSKEYIMSLYKENLEKNITSKC